MNWLEMWNQKATTENYFTQTGRGSSFTMYQFLLYIQDVQNILKLCKEDNLLDIGGGPAWVSMHLSPFVNSVTMTDFSAEMIEKAKGQVKAFGNIRAFQENILNTHSWDLRFCMGFNKVLVGSVLQYLKNMDEVKQALHNIYNVMESGIVLFTHNPDLTQKESHLATVPLESLEMENDRLWIDPNEIYDIAMGLGFRTCRILPINPLIWQSTHMLDFMVIK
jgi:SAM-dependent methyltransferase